MAKGDVILKFDGQTAAFVQSCLAAKNAADAAANSTRNFGAEAAKAGNVATEIFTGVASALGHIPSVAEAASMAVKMTISAAESIMERVEQRAESLRQKMLLLSGAMADVGQIAKFPEVRQEIKNLSGQTVGGAQFTGGELNRVAANVFRKVGAEASSEEVVSSLGAYQKAVAAGLDEEGATDVAVQYARLSSSGNQDLAYAAHVYGLSEQDMAIVNRAKESGLDVKSTLNVIFAAHKKKERMRSLLKIEEIASRRHKSVADVISNPRSLPKELRLGAADINGGVADLAKEGIPSLDAAIDAASTDPELQRGIFERNTDVMLAQGKAQGNERDRERSDFRARVAAARLKDFPHSPWGSFFTGPNEYRALYEGERAPEEKAAAAAAAAAAANADALKQHADALNRNTQATDANTRAVGGGSSLSNNKEGQK